MEVETATERQKVSVSKRWLPAEREAVAMAIRKDIEALEACTPSTLTRSERALVYAREIKMDHHKLRLSLLNARATSLERFRLYFRRWVA